MEKHVLKTKSLKTIQNLSQHIPSRLWLAILPLFLAACASTPSVPALTETRAEPIAAQLPQVVPSTTPEVMATAQAAPQTQSLLSSVVVLDSEIVAPTPDNSDLWQRLRAGFGVPDLESDLVRKQEQWYASRPDYVKRMTERGSRYLFHIVEEVEKRGMPTELALLPFTESAFNPQAMSTAKASGMWQFVPATGRDYALKQNVFRDDRRDVLASTRAALDYLTRLNKEFGDWQLSLAAYNWGEGNVRRAIARNQKAGLPTDYENLRMPDETRNYIPKLQAVKNIVARPDHFALTLPHVANHPYFESVRIDRDIDLEVAARLAGMKLDEFKQLNPQMNKPVILAAGTPNILLPYDNAEAFRVNLAAHRGPLASWTAWVAPRAVKPADAARQVGMSEASLRDLNKIPPRMIVQPGSTLLVPRSAAHEADVSVHVADTASMALKAEGPALKRMQVTAGKRGETLTALAKRYRVNPQDVADWNKLSVTSKFAPGTRVVVFVPQRTTRRPGNHMASTSKAARTQQVASKSHTKTKPSRSNARTVRVASAH